MTETMWGYIITATAPTAAVMVSLFVLTRKQEQHSVQLAEIHVLTNSTLSTALVRIAELEKKVEGLNAALVFFGTPTGKAAAAAAAAAAANR